MSVLVYAESSEGKFKKIAFEAVSYGKKVAEQLGTTISVVTINADNTSTLSDYGAEKVINKRGTTWRKLSEAEQQQAEGSISAQAKLLAEHSSMIKRPIIEGAKQNLIGFDQQAIEALK